MYIYKYTYVYMYICIHICICTHICIYIYIYLYHPCFSRSLRIGVEFFFKTDSGYPKDAGVISFTMANLGPGNFPSSSSSSGF